MLKILFVSSELHPLIKTGGLADVAGSLPKALKSLKNDVKLLLPAYPEAIDRLENPRTLTSFTIQGNQVNILEGKLPQSNLKAWLIDHALFQRSGNPYVDAQGEPWPDNHLRFGLLCKATSELVLNNHIDWTPDVIHCNDWQTGLIPAILSSQKNAPATIFTIHNLSYQGLFPYECFEELGLPQELWSMDGLEFYGQLSFIKGGITYANRINAVSPTYAKEILQAEFAYGLEDLLKLHERKISGILNGVDYKVWDPRQDKHIEKNFGIKTLNDKQINKTHLQKRMKLPESSESLLIGSIGRLVEQKGIDLLSENTLKQCIEKGTQFVFLGSGQKQYETQLIQWSRQYPQNVAAMIGYDETLAHQIEAGADLFLMPSRFEPCGLNQLYSLRYGTLPLVRATGGLADTVVNADDKNIKNGTATGFSFQNATEEDLAASLNNAQTLFANNLIWNAMRITAMKKDFSWKTSAQSYMQLYQDAIKDQQASYK